MSRKRRKSGKRRVGGDPDTAAIPPNGELKPVRPTVLNPQPLNPTSGPERRLVAQTITEYKGPIPPPAFLLDYSNAINDGGERVFAMIEAESRHIQEQERTMLSLQGSLLKRGQLFAFVIALVSLGGAIYTAQFSAWLAGAMVTVGAGTLAVAFLGASRKNGNKESGNKKR